MLVLSAGIGTSSRNHFVATVSEKNPRREKRRRNIKCRKPLQSRPRGKFRVIRRKNRSGYPSFWIPNTELPKRLFMKKHGQRHNNRLSLICNWLGKTGS